jgi:hypothetical protein
MARNQRLPDIDYEWQRRRTVRNLYGLHVHIRSPAGVTYRPGT